MSGKKEIRSLVTPVAGSSISPSGQVWPTVDESVGGRRPTDVS